MAENLSGDFKLEALEADMRRLAEEIQRHKENPEMRAVSGQEIIKKSLQAIVTPLPLPLPPSPQKAQDGVLPTYAAGAPAESKLEIEYLVDIAFQHGLDKANAEAMKSSPFVMDAFHDSLAAKLYPELQRRGILK